MNDDNTTAAPVKLSRKQRLIHELKEVGIIVLYLACSLCFLATMRSLVLIQQGINVFLHSYTVAIVEALALGKVVALAQRLPLLRAWDQRSLALSVLYKSTIMTFIVDIAGKVEETVIFKHSLEAPVHPLLFMVSHQVSLLTIFIVLFTVRGLNRLLGGTLFELVFRRPSVNQATGQ